MHPQPGTSPSNWDGPPQTGTGPSDWDGHPQTGTSPSDWNQPLRLGPAPQSGTGPSDSALFKVFFSFFYLFSFCRHSAEKTSLQLKGMQKRGRWGGGGGLKYEATLAPQPPRIYPLYWK